MDQARSRSRLADRRHQIRRSVAVAAIEIELAPGAKNAGEVDDGPGAFHETP